jgi:sulfite reductase (NADPH) flavoprotein alpha-component
MVPTVWYFAYGSNMQAATFRGRRGIAPLRAIVGRAAGWRLVFDKPSLLGTPEGYANIVPDSAAEVLGVLYEITQDDLEHVELTEGVKFGNYDRVELSVAPLIAPGGAGPAVHLASSLASEKRNQALLPSRRYLELVVDGAVEHGLPAEYVELLRRIATCEESPEAQQMRGMLDKLMRRKP